MNKNLSEILKYVSKKIGIKKYTDWYNVSEDVIKSNGGTKLVTTAKRRSLGNIISSVIQYTEDGERINWELWRFKHFCVPKNFWKDETNQRKYMEYLQKEKGFKDITDWYSISYSDFATTGGSGLLDFYGGSMSTTVTSVFKEYKDWMIWKFNVVPKAFWTDFSNQKKFMDWLGKELGFRAISDYYNIRKVDISARGGNGLLKLYKNSPSAIVTAIYGKNGDESSKEFIASSQTSSNEEIQMWNFRKVPSRFWNDKKNQRLFLEYVAKEENINKEEDWYNKISSTKIKEYGGNRLLDIFGYSPYLLLASVFPEVSWKPWLFNTSPKFTLPSSETTPLPTIVSDYMKDLSTKLKIKVLDDWYRVSRAQIDMIGGRNIIDKYGGLNNVLMKMYPNHNWVFKEDLTSTAADKSSKILNTRFKRASQRWLFVSLQNIFPQLGNVLFISLIK